MGSSEKCKRLYSRLSLLVHPDGKPPERIVEGAAFQHRLNLAWQARDLDYLQLLETQITEFIAKPDDVAVAETRRGRLMPRNESAMTPSQNEPRSSPRRMISANRDRLWPPSWTV